MSVSKPSIKVNNLRPKTTNNAISLFAGCGGDTLGMEMGGLEVVGYVECDENAIKSHQANFPQSQLIGRDITQISDQSFQTLAQKQSISVIFGGFPCQGFSQAGKKDPNDKRNLLFWEFLRAVRIIRPRWVIGENVKGLLTKLTTTQPPQLIKDLIIAEFTLLGYEMTAQVVKATNYGLPQKRERLLLVGQRRDLNLPTFQWPMPLIPSSSLNLWSIIEPTMTNTIPFDPTPYGQINYVIDPTNSDPDHNPHKYLNLLLNSQLLSYAKRDSPHHGEIIDINQPAKTIICTYSRQPRLFVPIKNHKGTYLRMLTISELQQIQGFPKTFQILGKTPIQQIGNAVPPPLVARIIDAIRVVDPNL